MFNKNQLAGLMKQAQAMQTNMKKAQDELAQLEVVGEAGSGAVKITITGKHQVRRVQLDESLLVPEDTWTADGAAMPAPDADDVVYEPMPDDWPD